MHFVFVCDATTSTGLGHLSRCLGLAEALRREGVPAMFRGYFEPGARDMLDNAGFKAANAAVPALEVVRQLIEEDPHPDQCVVLDCYGLDASETARLGARVRLILWDDFAALKFYRCSAIINFTLAAPRLSPLYRQKLCSSALRQPTLLLGTGYFPARERLRSLLQEQERSKLERLVKDGDLETPNLLVCMGGSDEANLTARVLASLHTVAPSKPVRVIVGKLNPHQAMLKEWAAKRSAITLVFDALDLGNELAQVDLCICAGGLVKYEAAYMGVAAAVYSQNAEQNYDTQDFVAQNLAFTLGSSLGYSSDVMNGNLHTFLQDADLQNRLRQRCRMTFPINAPTQLARLLLENLK